MTPGTIARVETRLLTAAMPRPWVVEAPWLHVIVVEIETSDGRTGVGFSWTPTIGAAAVKALIDNDITDFVRGLPADAATVWPRLWRHLHEAGGGGITTSAMAGIDIALWDLAGKSSGRSITELIGRRRESVPVYGSDVNLHYTIDELVAQVERWVRQGYRSVKVKVGKPDPLEDLDRIAAVRGALGPDRGLMIDANQRWNLPTARRSIGMLEQFNLLWVEEPLLSDDLLGYRELRPSVTVPIAMGENVHTIHRFRDLIDGRVADILQPNVVRVGGITPFLQIASLAAEDKVRLAPHLLIDLSGQLALSLGEETAVEDVEEADFTSLGLLRTASPVRIEGDRLSAANSPGTGLDFER